MKTLGFGFASDAKAVLAAMSRSQAIIEFDLTGKIQMANANFCAALG
jgi:methyl-accepting chemotaxis protein